MWIFVNIFLRKHAFFYTYYINTERDRVYREKFFDVQLYATIYKKSTYIYTLGRSATLADRQQGNLKAVGNQNMAFVMTAMYKIVIQCTVQGMYIYSLSVYTHNIIIINYNIYTDVMEYYPKSIPLFVVY